MVTEFIKEKFGAPKNSKKYSIQIKNRGIKDQNSAKKRIEKQIKGEDIFFTDETGIDLNPFSYDYIRQYPEEQKNIEKKTLSFVNQ